MPLQPLLVFINDGHIGGFQRRFERAQRRQTGGQIRGLTGTGRLFRRRCGRHVQRLYRRRQALGQRVQPRPDFAVANRRGVGAQAALQPGAGLREPVGAHHAGGALELVQRIGHRRPVGTQGAGLRPLHALARRGRKPGTQLAQQRGVTAEAPQCLGVFPPGGGSRGGCIGLGRQGQGRSGIGPGEVQDLRHHLLNVEGLADVRVHARRQAALAVLLHGVGGHGQHRQHPQLQPFADLLGRLQAVEFGHLHVHQHRIETLWIGRQCFHRLPAVLGQPHLGAFAPQHGQGHLLIECVVLGQQETQALQARRTGGRHQRRMHGHVSLVAQGQCDIEGEGGTLARLAVQRDLPPHHGHQPLADGQAQAGTAEAAGGGGLPLRETVEDARLLLRRDANAGVLHLEAQVQQVAVARQLAPLQPHVALGGELDGVAAQVDEHLFESHRIAHQHVGQGRVGVEHQGQRFVAQRAGQDDLQLAAQVGQAERHRVQFHLAGLDLGEVQDVVDDFQQRTRRTQRLAHHVRLLGRQRRLAQQLKHAHHGVDRRADLVAHVGQELALAHRSRIGAHQCGLQFGHVAAQHHPVAVGGHPVDKAKPAPVGGLPHPVGFTGQRRIEHFLHPVGLATQRFRKRAAVGHRPQHIVVAQCLAAVPPGRQPGRVGVVAVHEPLIGIEERKGFAHRVHGAVQDALLLPDALLRLHLGRVVLHRPDDATGHAHSAHALGMLRPQGGHQPHPALRAEAHGPQGCQHADLHAPPLGQLAQLRPDGQPRASGKAAPQVLQRAQFAFLHAQQLPGLRGHLQLTALQQHRPATDPGQLAGAAQQRLALAQLDLRHAMGRDVRLDADEFVDLATRSDQGRHQGMHPEQPPLLVAVADFALPRQPAANARPHVLPESGGMKA